MARNRSRENARGDFHSRLLAERQRPGEHILQDSLALRQDLSTRVGYIEGDLPATLADIVSRADSCIGLAIRVSMRTCLAFCSAAHHSGTCEGRECPARTPGRRHHLPTSGDSPCSLGSVPGPEHIPAEGPWRSSVRTFPLGEQ